MEHCSINRRLSLCQHRQRLVLPAVHGKVTGALFRIRIHAKGVKQTILITIIRKCLLRRLYLVRCNIHIRRNYRFLHFPVRHAVGCKPPPFARLFQRHLCIQRHFVFQIIGDRLQVTVFRHRHILIHITKFRASPFPDSHTVFPVIFLIIRDILVKSVSAL